MNSCEAQYKKKESAALKFTKQNKTRELSALRLSVTQTQEQETTQEYSLK